MSEVRDAAFSLRKLYFYITETIHPYSLIAAVLLDLVWSLFEFGSLLPGIGLCIEVILMGIIFATCFPIVYTVQHKIAGDDAQAARQKGLIFATLAALPFSVVGVALVGITGMLKVAFGYDRYAALAGKVILAWAQLEKSVDRLLPASYLNNIDDDSGKISRKLHYLRINQTITQDMYDDISFVRHVRNGIAHWNSRLPSEQELQDALHHLTRINQQLM